MTVVLTAGAALLGTVAAAQERPAALARVGVALWPEYDRPSVLVMYRVHLAEGTKLPAVIDLPMPAAAGEPHAVATRGADGGLYVAPYTRTVKGDWATVAVTADALDVQLEYYMPLVTSTPKRQFSFTWPGGIAVSDLEIDVQKPATATDFQVKPPPAETSVRSDGLTYARVRLGAVPARGRATVTVAYTKPDAELTAPPGQAQAEQGQSIPPSAGQAQGEQGQSISPAAGSPAAPEPPPGAPPVATRGAPASRDPVVWIVVAAIAIVFFVAGILVSRGGRSKKP